MLCLFQWRRRGLSTSYLTVLVKALWALPVKNGGVASLCLEYNRGRRCGLCMSVLIKGGVASLSISVKEGVCVWGGCL